MHVNTLKELVTIEHDVGDMIECTMDSDWQSLFDKVKYVRTLSSMRRTVRADIISGKYKKEEENEKRKQHNR